MFLCGECFKNRVDDARYPEDRRPYFLPVSMGRCEDCGEIALRFWGTELSAIGEQIHTLETTIEKVESTLDDCLPEMRSQVELGLAYLKQHLESAQQHRKWMQQKMEEVGE